MHERTRRIAGGSENPGKLGSQGQRLMRVVTPGPHLGTGFVSGLPFSANVSSEHEGGRHTPGFWRQPWSGKHRRTDLASGLSITVITDPVAGKIHMINSGSGTVSETPWPYPQGSRFGMGSRTVRRTRNAARSKDLYIFAWSSALRLRGL